MPSPSTAYERKGRSWLSGFRVLLRMSDTTGAWDHVMVALTSAGCSAVVLFSWLVVRSGSGRCGAGCGCRALGYGGTGWSEDEKVVRKTLSRTTSKPNSKSSDPTPSVERSFTHDLCSESPTHSSST